MKQKAKIRQNQQGIASIVIVMLIMTFLTLITLAMTQDANREQRQSLDRQLNSQAFYAAESGINDVKDYLRTTPGAEVKKSDCQPVTGAGEGEFFPGQTSRVGPTENEGIRYSCVMYNAEPDSLIYQLNTTESELVSIKDGDGRTIRTLTFSWRQSTGGNNFSGCPTAPQLPPALHQNCTAAGLRAELIDADTGITDREQLIRENFLAYIMPSSSGGANPSYVDAQGAANKQGKLWYATCSDGQCSLTINNVNKKDLLLHIRSLYKNATLTITGTVFAATPSGFEEMNFKDAQLMVDSTGRASDILKRIQVRVPIGDFAYRKNNPEAAIQTSDDICKLLDVLPTEVNTKCSL